MNASAGSELEFNTYGKEIPHIIHEYRCACYSTHALIIRQSPKLASLRQWAWWRKLSMHLITQYARVFLIHVWNLLACV